MSTIHSIGVQELNLQNFPKKREMPLDPVLPPAKKQKPSGLKEAVLVREIAVRIKPSVRVGECVYAPIEEMGYSDFIDLINQKGCYQLLQEYVREPLVGNEEEEDLINGNDRDSRVQKIHDLFEKVVHLYQPVPDLKTIALHIYKELKYNEATSIPKVSDLLQLILKGGQFAYLFSPYSLNGNYTARYGQARNICNHLTKLQKGESLHK